jgi:GTPase
VDEHAEGASAQAERLLSAYETVRGELGAHGGGLDRLPEIVAVSKRDLLPEAELSELTERLGSALGDRPLAVHAISSATGTGLDELIREVFAAVPAAGDGRIAADERAAAVPDFEAEHVVYAPAGEQGFDIVREDDAYRVEGRGVELLIARHDLSNPEALAYLEQRLREIGVIAALERAGFTPGDEVRIGEEEFELDPS